MQAEGFQKLLACSISLLLRRVDGAINLDDEAFGGAEQVHHEGAKGLLAAEPAPVELPASQGSPQNCLTRRGLLAELPGDLYHLGSKRWRHLPRLSRRVCFLW